MKILSKPTLAWAVAALVLSSQAAWAQQSDTLQKIKETGTITLGYRDSSIPFSYLDAQQKPVGLSIDLCQAIVARVKDQLKLAKLDTKMVAVNSSNRIPLVMNGTVDIECGGTANNAARQKQVAFSVATYASQTMWLARADAGVSSAADLAGKTIVVTQGSDSVGFARKIKEDSKVDFNVLQAKDHAESHLTLESGRAVAWLEADILLAGERANSRNPSALKLLPAPGIETFYYGLVFRKDDPGFKALVDGTLTSMMKSGEFTRLYNKWFENPIPPKNVNLNFPMGDKLKERVKSPSDKIEG